MRTIQLCLALLCSAPLLATAPARAAEGKTHHVVFQIDVNDPDIMNLTLNNATNVIDYYRDKHEEVELDVVAFGPGLNMYRADKSKVADRIKHLADYSYPSRIQFSACNNTKVNMERTEGHPVELIPEATLVPSGVVHIVELQEKGWSYVRP
jgi:intracellular sulfur oxidation DsrE/DsrF family protein